MRGKKLLAAFLLGAGLCLVPVLGQGEVKKLEKLRGQMYREMETSSMDFHLLDAKIRYIMHNPTDFLNVWLFYDHHGKFFEWQQKTGLEWHYPFLKGVDTKGKVIVMVTDNRAAFFHQSEISLLGLFKKHLMALYLHIGALFPDMESDIIAGFYNEENIPLGYFYQGEYHLWRE